VRDELKAQHETLGEQQCITALEAELRLTRTNGTIRGEESTSRCSARRFGIWLLQAATSMRGSYNLLVTKVMYSRERAASG
jgi:hypothetical protein